MVMATKTQISTRTCRPHVPTITILIEKTIVKENEIEVCIASIHCCDHHPTERKKTHTHRQDNKIKILSNEAQKQTQAQTNKKGRI